MWHLSRFTWRFTTTCFQLGPLLLDWRFGVLIHWRGRGLWWGPGGNAGEDGKEVTLRVGRWVLVVD